LRRGGRLAEGEVMGRKGLRISGAPEAAWRVLA
jgi:hypothetical protein